MTTYWSASDAIDAAAAHQLAAATLPAHRDRPADDDALLREEVRALAGFAPSAGVAAAMPGRVVPIDRMTLEPTGGVLASYAGVLAHYRANAADGVALLAGTQPDGSTLVVVRADTPETYRAWLHEACTERVERRDDDEDPDRVTYAYTSLRDLGRHSRLGWAPPPLRARSVTAFGGALIREVSAAVNQPRRQILAGAWSTWALGLVFCTPGVPDGSTEVALPDGQSVAVPRYRRLTFKTHKLGRGVDLVADGPVPAHVVREDGWTFSISGTPQAHEMPDWLIAAFGGQVAKTTRSAQ